ncbi:MAG: TAT-variant-translocated molybdopterin oxidoreductase [Ichthyobacteriaceae bacterium]|nr:TAT-variant-translocated molybdopterin oxidoreductase [Ichthyobacteriaceae bacterium]
MSVKKYWKAIEDLNEDSVVMNKLRNNEFVEEISTEKFLTDENLKNGSTSRRDFLKYVGFTTAVASLSACDGVVEKAIPYVVKPETITPGIADYYATSIADGHDFASVLVKNREGRPIKIEPNNQAKYFGTTNARIQASILELYDNNRLKFPQQSEFEISWHDADYEIKTALTNKSASGKQIVIVTSSMFSPSTDEVILKFKKKYPTAKHIVYDAVSNSGALNAFEDITGTRALPLYEFDKAKIVVSFGADFLGNWLGGGYEKGYSKGRSLGDEDKADDKAGNKGDAEMLQHYQIESVMSLTGANADFRYAVKPSEQTYALIKLYSLIVGGYDGVGNLKINNTVIDAEVRQMAKKLKSAGDNGLVVTGSNDKNMQILAMQINIALKSKAMNLNKHVHVNKGNDKDIQQLIIAMNSGKVGALLTYNVNMVYSLANSKEFVRGLDKVQLKISMSKFVDETAKLMDFNFPTPHSLESWGDAMPIDGEYALIQPTIKPLYNTRQFQDNLLKWAGVEVDYYSFLKKFWQKNILTKKEGATWNKSLYDGVFSVSTNGNANADYERGLLKINIAYVVKKAVRFWNKTKGTELELYVKLSMGNGVMANNPWLQELPDPITRTSWDNYLTISQKQARELGLKNWNEANGAMNGSLVKLTKGNKTVTVPVFIQPGQAYGSVGLALGYGRKVGVKSEMQTGVNAYKFYKNFAKYSSNIEIEKLEGEHKFACVQLHNTLMDRDIIRETTFDKYKNEDKENWNPTVTVKTEKGKKQVAEVDIWKSSNIEKEAVGHHFNLSIDLTKCTGCASCVVACNAENNVAVVGKEEVRNSRDMHWLRIDRYYSSDMTKDVADENGLSGIGGTAEMYDKMEIASNNPEVVFQPVMCQHCNHAPCETVCPVVATTHGKQGQNQMAYNRCVGTRYCANNCPYKVRRFNWFQYAENDEFDFNLNDDVGRMVLNPDVTVRSRGVMEKCSMCIQITQAGILKAKQEGRKLTDADIQPACASACSYNAIVFGDINQKSSAITKEFNSDRKYYLLEELGTQPNLMYQTKVRNK